MLKQQQEEKEEVHQMSFNDELADDIFAILSDKTPRPPDSAVPSPETGYEYDFEQMLSSIMIPHLDNYGSRSQYVMMKAKNRKISVLTREFENGTWRTYHN